jgi:phosphate transport system permease protein
VAIIDSRHAAKQLIYERVFRSATLTAAILVLLILGGVALSLLRGAWPALQHFGFAFVTREIWNPVTDEYGALAPIYGTVVTSVIAMLLAVPTASDRAVPHRALPAVAQAPDRHRGRIAGGGSEHHFRHLGPVRARAAAAASRAALAHRSFGADAADRQTLFGAALRHRHPHGRRVLAIMVLPFIAATMRDVFDTVPPMLKESGYGLGARPGKSFGMWSCRIRASACWAASCSGSGARSARPWP